MRECLPALLLNLRCILFTRRIDSRKGRRASGKAYKESKENQDYCDSWEIETVFFLRHEKKRIPSVAKYLLRETRSH